MSDSRLGVKSFGLKRSPATSAQSPKAAPVRRVRGGFKPFRERNKTVIGIASLAVIAGLLLAAFQAQNLPLIGGGDQYFAEFSETGGLDKGDEVRIAGVRVGKVDSLTLDGNRVRVGMRVKTDAKIGSETRATIRVKTILGAMFVALEPDGPGELKEGGVIGVNRTTAPYDIVQAFSGLAETTGGIDSDQLGEALTVLADLTRTTPESFRQALAGVSALSRNLAAKDDQIGELLTNLDRVATVLNERDTDIVALMADAESLFTALISRREAIHDVLVAASELSTELTGLIRDTRGDLAPALSQLQSVLDVLTKNEENLDESLRLMGPFYRLFANVLGNGPWFDAYIYNIPPVPVVGR